MQKYVQRKISISHGIQYRIIFIDLGKTIETMSVAMAATKIQNLWKGAIARRQVKIQREEELAFIGMVNIFICRLL